jgi:F0F1-type ATP synthase membrane subunit c/vacuolar-type H+-ATPase subunit K
MMFQIRLLRGLRHPNYFTYELKNTEAVGKIWSPVLTLILLSGLIAGLSGFFGIGSEYLSKNLVSSQTAEYEMQKALFVIGQILWGLFYGTVILYLSALWFWSLSDTELKRFVIMQLLVLVILLLEKLISIPVCLVLGVPEISSPFSLGPIAQSVMDNGFLVNFFASITLFKVWVIWVQYQYVRALTEKSRAVVWALVLGLNLIYWLFSALFSIIQFEKII